MPHKDLKDLTSEALFGVREIVDPDEGTTTTETEFIELIDGMCADVIAPLVEELRRPDDRNVGKALRLAEKLTAESNEDDEEGAGELRDDIVASLIEDLRELNVPRTDKAMSSIKEAMMNIGAHLFALPSEYGGMRELITPRILSEFTMRLGRVGGTDIGLYFGASNELFLQPILSHADKKTKDFVLPLIAQGSLGCFALTEEGAGSNPTQMETKIDLMSRTITSSPGKRFITSAPQSRFALVVGVSNEKFHKEDPRLGMTAVLLDREDGGFTTGAPEKKLGIKWSFTSDVIIPQGAPIAAVIGMAGQGYVQVALESLAHSRATGIPSQFVGLNEYIYILARDRAFNHPDDGGREQFGRRIGEFHDIADMLLDIETRAWLGRLLTLQSSTLMQDNPGEWKMWEGYASMAKIQTTEGVVDSADDGVQIFGGDGFMSEMPIAIAYGDARIGKIYEGTTQIQKFPIFKRNIGPMLAGRDLKGKITQAEFMYLPWRLLGVLANNWPLRMIQASESGDGSAYAKKMRIPELRTRFILAFRDAYKKHPLTREVAASLNWPAVYLHLVKVDAAICAAELGAWQADYLDRSGLDVVSEFGTDLEKLLKRAVSMAHSELELLERAFL